MTKPTLREILENLANKSYFEENKRHIHVATAQAQIIELIEGLLNPDDLGNIVTPALWEAISTASQWPDISQDDTDLRASEQMNEVSELCDRTVADIRSCLETLGDSDKPS